MPITIGYTSTSKPRADAGQYDLRLDKITPDLDHKLPNRDTGVLEPNPQLILDWEVLGEVDSAGDPKYFTEWVNVKWGSPQYISTLRDRVYALVGGKKYAALVDSILALAPDALDLEWLLDNTVLAELGDVPKASGGTKLKMTSCMADRANADVYAANLKTALKASNPQVYATVMARAGFSDTTGAARPAKPLPFERVEQNDDADVPF